MVHVDGPCAPQAWCAARCHGPRRGGLARNHDVVDAAACYAWLLGPPRCTLR